MPLLSTGELYALAAGGGGGPSVTFISYTRDTADGATSKTFSGVAFGADADDLIVVLMHFRGTGTTGNQTISSFTIGGVTATPAVVESHSGRPQITAIYYARPNASSGDVAISFSNARTEIGIGVYRLSGQSSDTPTDTGSNEALTGGTLSVTGGCDVPDDGVLLAAATANTTNVPFTAGVSADYADNTGSNGQHTGGSFTTASATAARTVTIDPASTDYCTVAAASWALPGLL